MWTTRHVFARPTHRQLAIVPLVAGAYYVASLAGLVLRLPPSTPSIVWPPNAVLTTALLFVPPRLWWLVVVSAFPAHVAVQAGTFPLPLIVAFFATNFSEAFIAAVPVRRFTDVPLRFDTLRQVAVFIGAVVLVAPLASGFLDALAASTLHGDAYWDIWRRRLPANVLTEIAFVPALSALLHADPRQILASRPGRWLESITVASGLLTLGVLLGTDLSTAVGFARIGAPAFLPFQLWAAVRFGPTGAAFSILVTVVVAIVAAVGGGGIVFTPEGEEAVTRLQTLLVVSAIPIMCVAALVEERSRAQAALGSADLLKTTILSSLANHVGVPVTQTRGNSAAADAANRQRNLDRAFQGTREELVHITRRLALGELTASLSHQLCQPLTAICGNAQAGRRMLEAASPDLEEIRQIFADVTVDAARAADLLGDLRDMLRKGTGTRAALDVNDLIRDTIRLVNSESLIRSVSVHLDLAPVLPPTLADRVQVQQVLLNLFINAMEAMEAVPDTDRTLLIETKVDRENDVLLSVADTGPGLGAGADGTVFEPFYTTKPSGLGMGLAIARSIVESHGGHMWVAPSSGKGAIFHLTLPAIYAGRHGGRHS